MGSSPTPGAPKAPGQSPTEGAWPGALAYPDHTETTPEGAEIRREHRGRGWRPEVLAQAKPNWNQLWPGRNPDLSIRAQKTRLRGWAAEEWDCVVKGLEVIGLLSVLDTSVVQVHCSAFALYREAMRRVGEDGSPSLPPASVLGASSRLDLMRATTTVDISMKRPEHK